MSQLTMVGPLALDGPGGKSEKKVKLGGKACRSASTNMAAPGPKRVAPIE